MKNPLSFAFCFLFFTSFLSAQQNKVDSLLNVLKAVKEDTAKADVLIKICNHFINTSDYEQAMKYANDALTLSEKIHFLKGNAAAYGSMGLIHWYKGDFDMAIEYFYKALNIFEKMPMDSGKVGNKKGMASTYNNLGLVYWNQGDYDKAIEMNFKSLQINEELNYKKGIADSYHTIGIINDEKGNSEKAMEYFLKALQIREELNDKWSIANSYNSIGITFAKKRDFDKALEYFFKCLNINKELNDKAEIATLYFNIGNIYEEKSDYSKAIEHYSNSLKMREEIGNKLGIGSTHINMGYLYLKVNKPVEAKQQAQIGLDITKEIGAKREIISVYQLLSMIDSTQGNFKGAYENHRLYSEVKDSLFNEESNKQITEMQTKYETEKKEQQIKLLNKDKEIQAKDLERQKTIRNAVAGGLILVLLFSFVLINRLLLIRKQKKVIEVEREKSEKLLLNILPKEIAEELKGSQARKSSDGLKPSDDWLVKPKRYEQVTVMFTDFKGFTTIAEKMSAEELVSELDFIFKKFDEIISKYPIEKIKTIGDAYMCAGGLPTPNESNPMYVVMAALEIQEWMCLTPNPSPKERGELPPLRGGLGWGLRIGIHTGSVIAGVVGDKKFAYDIWGDTVNTASRMESSGEAGKVNISGATYKFLVGARHAVPLRFTFRGKIPAKNKGEIEMYFVEKA